MKNEKVTAQAVIDMSWQAVLVLAVAVSAGLMPEMTMALFVAPPPPGPGGGGGGTIGKMLCTVNNWFTGPLGQGLATLALVVIGVGALMGKVGWGMAIIVGVGIAIIFGAATIVNEIAGAKKGCS